MKLLTKHVDHPHSSTLKRAKIIATVGPATDSYEQIYKLIEAGANGLRLNFSHGTYEERAKQIKWIRKAATELGENVAIIQDLQGPKIRLGDFEGVLEVKKGQSLSFKYRADYQRTGHLQTQYDLSKKVKRGERVLLFDGKVQTTVTSVRDGVLHVTVENDGFLIARKGINLPDTDFGGDIITEKDKSDIAYGSTVDIDYVALSFVQTANDIRTLRTKLNNLNSKARIIAKIETAGAVENIEEIVIETDAVMVARGDLAIETQHELVPVVQRKIIGLGHLHSKPTIVATQMMGSMVENPEPSRAEVSDVATAVLIGADCVMLSDETANGKYPIEAVKMMKKVIRYSETNLPLQLRLHDGANEFSKQSAICNSIITLAKQLPATAIVAETKSGATALQIAARRPEISLLAVTSDARVANQLAICYGVKSYVRKDGKYAASKLTDWLLKHKVLEKGDIVITASGKYPGVVGTTDTIKVRALE